MSKQLQEPPQALDNDVVSKWITERWTDLKTAYWIYHSWIWESILMYAGQLWTTYNTGNRWFEPTAFEDPDTPQPRINRFAPTIDAIASNFQTVPDIEAVPTPSDDAKCIGIAEVCNELSRYLMKTCALRSDYKTEDDKVGMASQWFVLGGSFMTNVYVEQVPAGQKPVMTDQAAYSYQCLGTPEAPCDTFEKGLPEPPQACQNCGNPGIDVMSGIQQVPQPDEFGQPMMEPVTKPKVHCDIEGGLLQFPRPGAKNMADTGWFILAERWSLDRIWSDLGIEDAQPDTEYPDGWTSLQQNALKFFYLGSTSNTSDKDAALVIRVYCEPGKVKQFPEGFFAVYINGKCKKLEPWDFVDHPLTKFDYKALPTLFFARSVAFDLTAIQREKCDYSSFIKLHAMTTAADPWVVEKNSIVGEIAGRGDKVVEWEAKRLRAEPPHHAGAGHLDNGVYAMDDKLDKEFENIGMVVQVWKGESPDNAKSGVALQTLRSQAELMFAGPTGSFAGGWKETVRKGVRLYQKHFTVDQLIEIVGAQRASAVQDFVQCDLEKAVEWISSKFGLPRTRDEKRQEMITLFDRGLLDVNDAGVKEKGFELFGETGMLSTFNKDATRARLENAKIKTGELDATAYFSPEFDDNEVHLAIHLDLIKSNEYLALPDEIKIALGAHALMHKNYIAATETPEPVQPGKDSKPSTTPKEKSNEPIPATV